MDPRPHDSLHQLAADVQDVQLAVTRNAWRLDALDKWRERVDRDLEGCRKDLDGMISADQIADAVAARAREDMARVWSWPKKCAAFLGAAVVTAAAVSQILSAFGVIG